MEHQALVFAGQRRLDLLHARRRDAERVRPIAGSSGRAAGVARASRAAARRAFTMPAIACAPLASSWREIALRPCTSVTEYIIMMSAGPT